MATKSAPKLSNYSTTAAMNGSIALTNNATLATAAANYGLKTKTVVDQHSLDIAARITPLEVDTKVANALLVSQPYGVGPPRPTPELGQSGCAENSSKWGASKNRNSCTAGSTALYNHFKQYNSKAGRCSSHKSLCLCSQPKNNICVPNGIQFG